MTKILVVGMLDSVHLGRWLWQFHDQNLDFTLIPSSPHRRVHPLIKELSMQPSGARYRLARFSRWLALPLWVADRLFDNRIRGAWVRKYLNLHEFDIVHALELQNAGYILLRALEGGKPKGLKVILTNYGSDIFWFQRFKTHRSKLKRLLALADSYGCECDRDVVLARGLGFEGEIHPVRPNAGGFSPESLDFEKIDSQSRSIIAVKGYHGWAGRAHNVIKALPLISNQIAGLEVVVYSSNLTTRFLAAFVSLRTGLTIKTFGKGKLSHSEVLNLFSKSLIYVGVSRSDGISTSLLEAMAMGAIPAQSTTSCCREWFGSSGVSIENFELETIASAILLALELSHDRRNRAANFRTIQAKASQAYVRQAALSYYS